MRKENEFGSVQPGQRADLLLVDADPRLDVTALSKITSVGLRGIWLDHAALEGIRERVRALFSDEQGLADGESPTPERTDQLLTTITQLESDGAIQMDHNLKELKELLVKSKRSTAPIDALLTARKGK